MDTQKITEDLLATELTQKELAALVPCSQALINAFLSGKRGSRPSKVIGDRLEALHIQRCVKKRVRSRKPPQAEPPTVPP